MHEHQQHHAHPTSELSVALDLDAEVFGAGLTTALDRAQITTAASIVDLGAGSGAGSRMLRSRFPGAVITCVDNDPQMLQLLRAQGFVALEADLNSGFPEVEGSTPEIDLVWASSSLHHVSRPAELLVGAHHTLAPWGTLLVVELAGLPTFFSETAHAGLEKRLHAAAAQEGWNHYPDWTPALAAAGFEVTRFDVSTETATTQSASAESAQKYALQWLLKFGQLATLTEGDRAALSILSHDLDTNNSLIGELKPHAQRTVWVAHK